MSDEYYSPGNEPKGEILVTVPSHPVWLADFCSAASLAAIYIDRRDPAIAQRLRDGVKAAVDFAVNPSKCANCDANISPVHLKSQVVRLEALVCDLYILFTSTSEDIAKTFGEGRCKNDSSRINYALELMADFVHQ
jgi:hypothetical protein